MRNLDIKTKYFDQDSYQIPQLENTWGCMVDMLDMTLVYGTPVQDVVSVSVREDLIFPSLYWLSTLELSFGHGFKEGLSVVEIKGCSIPEYNNTFRVQEVSTTSVTIAFKKSEHPTMIPNVPGTLGMTIKLEPLGYEKAFEGPQKAAYRVNTPEDKFCFLRVDNSCPDGYTPSWAKMSRVSMLSEMKHIDDYDYRRGRKKAPAYSNYNLVEESWYNAWFNTRSNHTSGFDYKSATYTVDKFILIGDQSTFYLHIKDHRYLNSTNAEDVTYVFGAYRKYIYKEDPLPFILFTSRKWNDDYFDYQDDHLSITKDNYQGKYTFSTEAEKILQRDVHNTFALLLGDDMRSGSNTRVNFLPYNNEINLNLFPMNLRFNRPGNVVLEGRYRGLHSFVGNLQDSEHLAPRRYTVFTSEQKFYIRIQDHSEPFTVIDPTFAVLLNDWE